MKTMTLRVLLPAVLLGLTTVVQAATVDVADKPMTSAAKVIKPNLMFLLDASGSMAGTVMPDQVPTSTGRYAFAAAQCNGLAYDPTVTYSPPMRSDGSYAPNAVYTMAWNDGYVSENLTSVRSTTANAIGTGSRVFTLSSASGLNTGVGGNIEIVASADRGMRMMGTVTAYNSGTKSLTVNVTKSFGSGSFASWMIINPSVTDLSATTQYYFTYHGTQPLMGYTYPGGTLDTSTTFYKECNSNQGSNPGAAVFTQVTVTSASSDAQNYANWYSYYRTRINTMKTSMTLAFGKLVDPQNFRVGFSTIAYSGTTAGDDHFLKIDDYCTAATNCTQRQNFFQKIYRSEATSWTPLRNALSKAGLIYAGKLLAAADDPVQYYCQKHWAILSTDGYWNTGGGTGNGTNYNDWNDAGGFTIAQAGSYPTAGAGVGKQDGPTNTDYVDSQGNAVAMLPPMRDQNDYSNTLADVAMYYYKTDLRDTALGNCTSGSTGKYTCTNLVPMMTDDCNPRQHMNTITLGLGVSGTLDSCDYDKPLTGINCTTSGDYAKLKAGTVNWPNPGGSDARTIDDLWHAAINGRGVFLHPNNPQSIILALSKALAKVAAQAGGGSSPGVSALQFSASGADVYLTGYNDGNWDGDIREFTISSLGVLSGTGASSATCSSTSNSPPIWSARDQLQLKSPGARTIYTAKGGWGAFDSTNTNLTLTDFNPNKLSQYVSYNAGELAEVTAAGRADMINYLRGVDHAVSASNALKYCCENQSNNDFRLFRDRDFMLGDIVHSPPYFVGKSPFQYGDFGHSVFKSTYTVSSVRPQTLFAGANDGMLHAFDANTGDERWAFVPSAVVPNLYKLADFTYNQNHQYFVDGPVNVGDVCPTAPGTACAASQWKTLLVGGLGQGGRDMYALDITNPSSPSLRWEFSTANPTAAANLGRTFGTPLIAKIKGGTYNGKWVVIFSSGYNNLTPGDSTTHLFVVDAWTGALIWDIANFAGVETSPDKSGMGSVSGWTDHGITDNSVQHVYGGDLNGNVWRFDISTGAAADVVKLAILTDSVGLRQPITTKPELGEVTSGSVKTRVVFVGTGKWMGFYADVPASPVPPAPAAPLSPVRSADQYQSIYAIKDKLATTSATSAFRNLSPAQITVAAVGATGRSMSFTAANAVGWYADFPAQRERVTIDPELQVGWLSVTTSVPNITDDCATGGDSFQYFFPYDPKGTEVFQPWQAFYLGNSLAAGSTMVQLVTGQTGAIVQSVSGPMQFVPVLSQGSGVTVRRVSWRELVN